MKKIEHIKTGVIIGLIFVMICSSIAYAGYSTGYDNGAEDYKLELIEDGKYPFSYKNESNITVIAEARVVDYATAWCQNEINIMQQSERSVE